MKKGWGSFALVSLFLVSLPIFLCGQATSSAISGMVRDASQAVIPGAMVTVTNSETGISRERLTDEGGRFRVGELIPGTYQVTVSLEGFKRETRNGIVLMVGQEAALNFALEVGTVTQEVVVTGEAPLVETTTTSVASAVSQVQLRELPLNGRSFTDLVTLDTSAIAPRNASAAAQFGLSPQLTVAGGRPDANNFRIDGTDMSGPTNGNPGSAARVQLGVETVREFQVITSNPKAEYGRNSGAVVNAVTRSGTNDLHGSAYEFLRNNKLDARNFFNVGALPPFKRNQFGGALGGPIRRDRTFFFGDYEGYRERLTQTQINNVPTLDARQGIGILNPGEVVDPRIKPYLALYPVPNGANLGGGVAEYITTLKTVTNENYYAGRIDHNVSSQDSLFGRYTLSRANALSPRFDASISVLETTNQYFTLQNDHIFSPTVVATFRVGYNRSRIFQDASPVPGTDNLGFLPGQPMGAIGASGITSIGSGGATDGGALLQHVQNAFEYEGALTYTKGAHTMKYGALAERFQWNTDQQNAQRGTITFNGLRNFLLAGPTGTSATLVLPESSTYRHLRTTMFAFYAQDDYKITSNFMMSYGLRWEFTTGLSENDNHIYYMKKGWRTSTLNDLIPGKLWDNHIGNFEPRLGFNWAPGDQKTVFSGGIGTFHNQILGNSMISSRAQLPIYFRGQVQNVDARQFFPRLDNIIRASTLFRVTRHFDFDNFKAPLIYRYNFTIQRELPAQLALRLGYVGSLSRHLARRTSVNDYPDPIRLANGSWFFPPASVTPQFVNPNFDNIQFMRSDANGSYNAFNANLQKRLSRGLTFNAGYTWSKSLDDSSQSESNFSASGTSGQYDDDRSLNHARSDYNIPHVFVFNSVYELPLKSSGPIGAMLGGWQLSGILRLQQGTPFTLTSTAKYPGYNYGGGRPDLKPGVDVNDITSGSFGTRLQYFDTSVFLINQPGQPGTAGRNLILGPGLQTVDLTLGKVFAVREGVNMQFRGEFYNLLNHTNFAAPNPTVFTTTTIDPRTGLTAINPSAARITATATPARQVQLALKLTF